MTLLTKLLQKCGLFLLLLLYLYILCRVILFKFGSIEPSFLIDQLQYSFSEQSSITERLVDGGNIVPFREIERNIHSIRHDQDWRGFVQFAGNIIAFVPLGILLPLLFKKGFASLFRMMLASFFVSLILEVSQLVLQIGRFDVDDLILNTTGGVLGYIIYVICYRALSRRQIT
ncbi:VanZ family protein [Brevibacillus daliensis]|uniref:VanZ family protein n=1 Tax=Brevibacillus daliensis TaxID=2892995 RepID=UPI001E34FE16|nr:VanZ family protein [Brevibacillus daliensis]